MGAVVGAMISLNPFVFLDKAVRPRHLGTCKVETDYLARLSPATVGPSADLNDKDASSTSA